MSRSHRLAVLTSVACLALSGGSASAQADPEIAPDAGRRTFEAVCATCHGADGRGAPGAALFAIAMPDFSDCSFAAREPDSDWLAVVHEGGPARGFRPLMPAHGEALDDVALTAVLAHVRSLCRDARWPRGELNLPRPIFTEKAFPEDEAVVTVLANVEDADRLDIELLYEKRLGPRSQIELALPVLAREEPAPDRGWNSGVGDLVVGIKHAFFHDLGLGTITSLGAELRIPTGDEDRGLGKGTWIAEPWLAWGQILPWSAFLHVQAAGEIPFDQDDADPEVKLRAALGRTWRQGRFGRAWSPMVEALATATLRDAHTRIDVDLVPQLHVTLSRRQHVMLNAGVRLPVTRARERPTQVVLTVLWDWFDGGLLDGW